MDLPCVAKVLSYKKLMKDFSQFKDKRELFNEYDLFFADSRVYKMLPKCLGKLFYSRKKFPFPLKLHGGEPSKVERRIREAFECSYMMLGNGPNYSLRVARTSMNAKDAVKNIIQAVYRVVPHIIMKDGIKHSKVQCISLQTPQSVDLPIFNQLLKSEVEAYLKEDA